MGLIGPNGSGKSTCLRLGSALLAPKMGQVLLDGKNLTEYTPKQIARQIAFLPQRQGLPNMTVETLVTQGRYPYTGLGHRLSSQDRQWVAQAMEIAGVAHLAQRPLESLSGGQVQKARLAMVMAQQARHILLDEPMTYLDIAHQLDVMDCLRNLVNTGCAVVVVLHDLGQAADLCDQLMVLHEGVLIYDGKPQGASFTRAVEQAFEVRVHRRESLSFIK